MPTNTTKAWRFAPLLTAILVATALAMPAAAQDGPSDSMVQGPLEIGGKVVAAQHWLVKDGMADLMTADGRRVSRAEPWMDVVETRVARVKVNKGLRKKIERLLEKEAASMWSGDDAELKNGQELLVVIVTTSEPIPCDANMNLQLWTGFDGKKAPPAVAGSWADLQNGTRTLTMGGLFAGDDDVSYATGTTDFAGLEAGGTPDLFGAKARDFGFCDSKTGSLVNFGLVPKDASSVRLAITTEIDRGLAYDHIGFPTDTIRMPLDMGIDPPGWTCLSIDVTPAEGSSAAEELMRLEMVSASDDPGFDSWGAAIDSLVLASALRPPEGELRLDRFQGVQVASMDVWPGRYTVLLDPAFSARGFQSPPGLDIEIDLGQDATVYGDPRCGRVEVPGEACEYLESVQAAEAMGVDPETVETESLEGIDGSKLCLLRAMGSKDPLLVLGIESDLYLVDSHLIEPFPPTCVKHPDDAEHEHSTLSCGGGDITSIRRQVPITQVPFQTWGMEGPTEIGGVPSQAHLRFYLDALRIAGVDPDTILSSRMAAVVDATAARLAAEAGVYTGPDY